MARYSFAGTPSSYVFQSVYQSTTHSYVMTLVSGIVTAWDSETGGNQVTDMLDSAGAPVDKVTVGPDGHIPQFQGPDGVNKLWLDAGGESRVLLAAQGLQGPQGLSGPAGPQGPAGDVDGLDIQDLTILFENGLA